MSWSAARMTPIVSTHHERKFIMPTANTVAELAIALPRAIPVFQRLKIDFCCNGGQTIQQACAAVGITGEELMDLIGREPAAPDARSWDDASLTSIIRFIVDTHHAYTRQ